MIEYIFTSNDPQKDPNFNPKDPGFDVKEHMRLFEFISIFVKKIFHLSLDVEKQRTINEISDSLVQNIIHHDISLKELKDLFETKHMGTILDGIFTKDNIFALVKLPSGKYYIFDLLHNTIIKDDLGIGLIDTYQFDENKIFVFENSVDISEESLEQMIRTLILVNPDATDRDLWKCFESKFKLTDSSKNLFARLSKSKSFVLADWLTRKGAEFIHSTWKLITQQGISYCPDVLVLTTSGDTLSLGKRKTIEKIEPRPESYRWLPAMSFYVEDFNDKKYYLVTNGKEHDFFDVNNFD